MPLNMLCPHPLGKSMIWDWLWTLNQSRCPKQPSWTLCFPLHLSEPYIVWALCDTDSAFRDPSNLAMTKLLNLTLTKSLWAFNVWNRGPLCFHHSGWLSLNKKQGQRHQQSQVKAGAQRPFWMKTVSWNSISCNGSCGTGDVVQERSQRAGVRWCGIPLCMLWKPLVNEETVLRHIRAGQSKARQGKLNWMLGERRVGSERSHVALL